MTIYIVIKIFVLLILFQLKHFLADYPLQNKYMLQKFRPDWGFFLPLVCHCLVHSLFTFCIIWFVSGDIIHSLKMSALDFGIHFIMDRIKAGPKYLGRFKALTASEFATATDKQKRSNQLFWWSLGLDQTVHHLTHYVIIGLTLFRQII